MKIGDKIRNFKELQTIAGKGYFDVRIILSGGLFSRKTVYDDLGTFSYIDETEMTFKNLKQAQTYWDEYFKNNTILFDGYN